MRTLVWPFGNFSNMHSLALSISAEAFYFKIPRNAPLDFSDSFKYLAQILINPFTFLAILDNVNCELT